MLATPHALVGAIIASKVHNPALGIPIAFFSHFLFDLVPHWDWGWHPNEVVSRITNPAKRNTIFWESVADVIFGFVLSYLVFGQSIGPVYLFAMIIAAQGPDWLCMPSWLLHIDVWPVKLVCQVQHKFQRHAKLPWGILNQIAAVAGFGILMHLLF